MVKTGYITTCCLICIVWALTTGCAAHNVPEPENPEITLRKTFPALPFESVRETEIKGLYEVVSGLEVFYYCPEKEYLIFGEIFDSAGTNLTAERKGGIAAGLVKTLPLEKGIKKGDGKTVVIEFTDPDCPFCRKAYDFFKSRSDVTIYSFLVPLAHPGAISKIYYILNAEDRAKAYSDVFEGKNIVQPKKGYSDSVKKLAREHMELARSMGVNGTPTFFINGKQVVGADFKQIEMLLGDNPGKEGEKPENSDNK
jgi:thiol:disulfide interchange protein DsbC